MKAMRTMVKRKRFRSSLYLYIQASPLNLDLGETIKRRAISRRSLRSIEIRQERQGHAGQHEVKRELRLMTLRDVRRRGSGSARHSGRQPMIND
jgi:hypothetical protein